MQNKTLNEVSIFGLSNWAEGIADFSLGRRAAHLDSQLRLAISDLEEALIHVHGDSNLSDAGRENKRGQLGLEALNRIEKVAAEIPTISEWVDELGASLSVVNLKPSNDPVDFLREQEIRTLIQGTPEMERASILFSAIENGDTPTIRAFFLGPKAFPLTIPDVLEQGMIALTERANPVKSKEHKAALAGLQALKSGVETARRVVATKTNVGVEDMLMKKASGM